MKRVWQVIFLLFLTGGMQQLKAAETFVNSVGMKFVRMDSGSFMMGQQDGGDWDEKPLHKVTITRPFWMAVAEVTNAQYEQFDHNHRKIRGKLGFSKMDDEAVIFVNWHQAVQFCRWLSKKEGELYRLPTEAEWEYACRAGTMTSYHTGSDLPKEFSKNPQMSWFPDSARSHKDSEIVPLTVAQTKPNPWGLYDMHGNVEEWCYDWYGPYSGSNQTDPVGFESGDFKVTRGGSHGTKLSFLRSANRLGALPNDKSWVIGFRVVIGDMPSTKPIPVPLPPLNQRNVSQKLNIDLLRGPEPDKPYFKGPLEYVKIPSGSMGPLFSEHNHDPALVDCPNGDLLAIWYSCLDEPGRELTILASRLRYGTDEWEPASLFWDAPDRNDHAPALWFDGRNTIYHFNGLSAAATWGNLATIMRTSVDSGATWSKARLINPEHGLRHMPVESVFQTKEGFLILPCDAVTGGRGGTAVHVSRDGGTTWIDHGQGKPDPSFESGSKGAWVAGIHAGVVQLRDGSLMAFGRGNNIDNRMPMSISKDMGRIWTYSASEFPPIGGGQRLVLRRLIEGPILLISFTDRKGMVIPDAAGNKRRVFGMFAALSFDEGKTWPCKRLITAGGPAKKIEGGGNTGEFTMDDTHAEPKGYLAATQTPNGLIHLISSKQHYVFNLAWIKEFSPTIRPEGLKGPDYSFIPGVVINHSPASTGRYLGSPGLAVLSDGHYVVSHDFYGPQTKEDHTAVFCSKDAGKSWEQLTVLKGQYWSTIFVHNEALYIIGTTTHHGSVVIRRSNDSGCTWTIPKDRNTGLLIEDGQYHCAPVPVVVHNGRIWRAMEDRYPQAGQKGSNLRSFVMSAPVDSDLLKAESWTLSNRLEFDSEWPGKAWLEGNIVVTPQDELVNILRVECKELEVAAVTRISDDGRKVSFAPDKDFIHFYGGSNKFTIRYDGLTGRYWSLVSKQRNPVAYRNVLTLVSSEDLRDWRVESVILRHHDSIAHAFQYVDWLFDDKDIIAVSRTAFDDGMGGAHNAHDANFITFHRIRDFRNLSP
ncbi:MAG: SUMF1/EgtB/PvdO family nonheme iron enzyme [Sedimentisphaerales bacterium]|nr:SUMF1/EgtB/PvdO family nonheme iron enzyme [Sedimentisphaerales bacterium]